ncbi:MAG TPA: HAD family hydrolase [Clostridiales bacterium]|jgi:Cof subfamily protein (haloacid dehalogenase superfamily)|nr:HAD family hydrolase [Clostridiales bacterium]
MGKFTGTLIASDFDGTLVPSSKKLTNAVQEAVAYYMQNGGYFTVCTGRTHQGFPFSFPESVNAPVLLCNGGMAYDYHRNEVVFCDGIGDEGLAVMRDIRDFFPRVAIEMYPYGATYAIHLNEKSERHFTSQGIPFAIIDDPADAPRPWAKAMIGGEKEEIAGIQKFLAAYYHNKISFLPTTGGFLEVMRCGVDKGSALLKLARRLGVDKAHVYAVGDGYNDVEMLRAAALAFVPENGDAFSKAEADYIVRSNEEDAIVHVIEILDSIYK